MSKKTFTVYQHKDGTKYAAKNVGEMQVSMPLVHTEVIDTLAYLTARSLHDVNEMQVITFPGDHIQVSIDRNGSPLYTLKSID